MKKIVYLPCALFMLCSSISMAATRTCEDRLPDGQWRLIFDIAEPPSEQGLSECQISLKGNLNGSGTCTGSRAGNLINFIARIRKDGNYCKLSAQTFIYSLPESKGGYKSWLLKLKGNQNPDNITGGGKATLKDSAGKSIGSGVYSLEKIN